MKEEDTMNPKIQEKLKKKIEDTFVEDYNMTYQEKIYMLIRILGSYRLCSKMD